MYYTLKIPFSKYLKNLPKLCPTAEKIRLTVWKNCLLLDNYINAKNKKQKILRKKTSMKRGEILFKNINLQSYLICDSRSNGIETDNGSKLP